MSPFQIIGHTADVRLYVTGKDQKELFLSGLQALFSVIKPDICQQNTEYPVKQPIAIRSVDQTALLIDFLSEALTLSHEMGVVFCHGQFTTLTETSLKGFIYGKAVDSFDEDVKAVTYHEANIHRTKSGEYAVWIILDI